MACYVSCMLFTERVVSSASIFILTSVPFFKILFISYIPVYLIYIAITSATSRNSISNMVYPSVKPQVNLYILRVFHRGPEKVGEIIMQQLLPGERF